MDQYHETFPFAYKVLAQKAGVEGAAKGRMGDSEGHEITVAKIDKTPNDSGESGREHRVGVRPVDEGNADSGEANGEQRPRFREQREQPAKQIKLEECLHLLRLLFGP